MKKILSLLICVLLLCSLAVPVAAAGGARMSLSSSAGTLHRGDSFTVSVYLTNDQAVGRGGIVLSYDASVFEFVGGSCNVGGATLAEVSAGRNGGVFALEEDRVVSGTIFTINMRVKSSAAFGTYTISGTASMEISCSVSGTSVTVACDHSYGSYSAADGSSHQRTCSICKNVETTAHNWNGGTVTQAATCKDSGTMRYTCTDCGQTNTESIPPNDSHRYRDWTYVDETGHRGTCAVCGATVAAAHTWEFVEELQAATCTAAGTQTVRCVTCGHEKTEEIPVTEHDYGAFEAVDEASHSHTCADCGHVETLAHSYTDQYGHDAHGHYLICDGCGAHQEPQDHVPGPEATGNDPQLCTVCGRMLKAALNHVHSYLTEWSLDDSGHWYECEFCEDRSEQAFHSFDSACDDTCDACGYVREPAHDFSDLLTADDTGHYYPCRGCGEKKDFAAHTPGEEASIRTAQTCTVCGHEIAPRVAHDHEYTAENGAHYHTCVCGETTPGMDGDECPICAADPEKQFERFPWWVLCIVEAVLLAAAVVLLIIRKKK